MSEKKYSAPEIPFSDKNNKTEKYFNVSSRDLARKRVRDCKHVQDLRREQETPESNADLLDLYLAIIRVHVETEQELADWAVAFNENFNNPLDKEDVLKAAQYTFCFRNEEGKLCRQEVNAKRAIEVLNLTEKEQEQLETFRSQEVVTKLSHLKCKNPEPTKTYEPRANLKVFEIDPTTMPEQDENFMKQHKMYMPKKQPKVKKKARGGYAKKMAAANTRGKTFFVGYSKSGGYKGKRNRNRSR